MMRVSRTIAGSLFACFAVLAGCSAGDDHSAGDGYATSTNESEEALTKVCGQPTTGPVQGYDVSTYQGAFTWAGTGVKFGAARISDGLNSIDGQFDGNWARMKSAGVLRSAYQFFEPGQDETKQANMVIAKVGKLGAGDLPVMLDVEVTGGQSPATIRTKAQHWLDLVEAGTGKRPFVYSYGSFLETNLGSGFGKYPLWIANYGATCPSVPNGWTNWVIWQYSDGSGKLDHDVYNGSLAQLQALAGAGAPRGYLDSADCTKGIAGWAQDQSAPTASIDVDLFADVPLGSAGAVGYPILANGDRADLMAAVGSTNHGFSVATPLSLFDTKEHSIYVSGVPQGSTTANGTLTDAPRKVTCPIATIPLAADKAVKRHVTNPDSLKAWNLSTFWSLSQQTPATVADYTSGDDLEATPTVVQGDDGSAAVYVIDGAKKRHVVSPDSLNAWHFTVTKMEAAKLAAIEAGPDWQATPFMFQATGDAAVYLLDADPSTPAGEGGGADGGIAPTGSDPSTSPPGPTATNDDSSSGSDSGGCSVAHGVGATGEGSFALLGIGLGLALVSRRRRR